MLAHLAIQCKAATGATGTFLYVGPSDCRVPVSPIFSRSGELFQWCQDTGWSPSIGYGCYANLNLAEPPMLSVDGVEPTRLDTFVREHTAHGVIRPSASEWAALVSLQTGDSTFVGKREVKRIS